MEIAVGFAVTLAVALIVPSYIDRKHPETNTEWYNKHIQANIAMAPPSIVFPIVWTILYIFIAISVGIWSVKPDAEMSSGRYIATWVLIAFNILFNRLWTLIFFSYRRKQWSVGLALIDAILIFLTGLIVGILFHLSSESNVAVFVLWWIYVAWTLYAVVLNIAIHVCDQEDALELPYDPVEED